MVLLYVYVCVVFVYTQKRLWGIDSCDYEEWQVSRSAKWVNRLETEGSWWFSSKNRRANGLVLSAGWQAQDPGRNYVSLIAEGRKKPMSQFEGHNVGRILSCWGEGQPFCSILGFSWLDEACQPHGGQSALLCLPI